MPAARQGMPEKHYDGTLSEVPTPTLPNPGPLAPHEAARLTEARETVGNNAVRVAELGGWGPRANPDSLLDRIPCLNADLTTRAGMGGFDAGIACALDLIPRDRQHLAARLHAAYTPAAVAQARTELAALDADGADAPDDWDDAGSDSPTCWWLAACHVCVEGPVNATTFLAQLAKFDRIRRDPTARRAAAKAAARDMLAAFEVRDGIAMAVRDGGMQGAYLAGHHLAGQHAPAYGLYFLGTFHDTLGLESFAWQHPGVPDSPDQQTRLGRSGPVGGSPQFVKCCDHDEFRAAVAAATPRDLDDPQGPR